MVLKIMILIGNYLGSFLIFKIDPFKHFLYFIFFCLIELLQTDKALKKNLQRRFKSYKKNWELKKMNKYNYENSKEYGTITKELYINVFYGFYESIYCSSSQFIDEEYEDKYMLLDKYPFLNENDIEIYYEFENFENYKKDISKEFSSLYLNLIKELLPLDIIENPKFLLELKDSYIDSPQYYNYRTDKNGLFIETNYTTLNLIKNYVLSFENMEEYIYKKNSSYDGFISFLSNNYQEWKDKPIENYECNELSFLFDNVIIQNDNSSIYPLIFNLNYECYENIEIYEYIDPFVE